MFFPKLLQSDELRGRGSPKNIPLLKVVCLRGERCWRINENSQKYNENGKYFKITKVPRNWVEWDTRVFRNRLGEKWKRQYFSEQSVLDRFTLCRADHGGKPYVRQKEITKKKKICIYKYTINSTKRHAGICFSTVEIVRTCQRQMTDANG